MKRIVDWINRRITHDRDDVGDFGIRVLLHIPIGFIIGLFAPLPGLCMASAYLFRFYERNEDAHTEDEAWKDVFGALIGLVIAGLCWIGVIVWLLALIVVKLL